MKHFDSIRVGFFLALRSVKRGNQYVTFLVLFIMMLIFLNLVGIGGLLLGLSRGAEIGFIKGNTGTFVIDPLIDKSYLQDVTEIETMLPTIPNFIAYSPRLSVGVQMESHYKEKKENSKGYTISGGLLGIDPKLEGDTTNFPSTIIEGRYLYPNDRGNIIIGSILAGRGSTVSIGEALTDVNIGDKIKVTFSNGVVKEFTIVGFYKSLASSRNMQAVIPLEEMREILGVKDERLTQIAVRTVDYNKSDEYKKYFTNAGFDKRNVYKTWNDAMGSVMGDVKSSFNMIADIVGGIGLIVGGVTIFIVIFVNAINKRRFIGVLKASGVSTSSIVISYVLQGIFYTIFGVCVGLFVLYGILIPYIDIHPIKFPFADGIIYVTNDYCFYRVLILFVISSVSGFIPAYFITKENTLNAILGR